MSWFNLLVNTKVLDYCCFHRNLFGCSGQNQLDIALPVPNSSTINVEPSFSYSLKVGSSPKSFQRTNSENPQRNKDLLDIFLGLLESVFGIFLC